MNIFIHQVNPVATKIYYITMLSEAGIVSLLSVYVCVSVSLSVCLTVRLWNNWSDIDVACYDMCYAEL